ncbi:hypothetical protein P879_05310 [Paragonimus westermani]|uniref:Uncharacterized protein n=1 Tax=Paragonimus westermani TaxID=34504 RepID=A0A8T0DC82_9TREM|nr:hypothetical protein P879_05310 [Paragonimus westermani]
MFVQDPCTRIVSLADTEEQVARPCNPRHRPANGTIIHAFGVRLLTLKLGFRGDSRRIFVAAADPSAIIGIKFLRYSDLLVDTRHQKSIDAVACLIFDGNRTTATIAGPIYPILVTPSSFSELLQIV